MLSSCENKRCGLGKVGGNFKKKMPTFSITQPVGKGMCGITCEVRSFCSLAEATTKQAAIRCSQIPRPKGNARAKEKERHLFDSCPLLPLVANPSSWQFGQRQSTHRSSTSAFASSGAQSTSQPVSWDGKRQTLRKTQTAESTLPRCLKAL